MIWEPCLFHKSLVRGIHRWPSYRESRGDVFLCIFSLVAIIWDAMAPMWRKNNEQTRYQREGILKIHSDEKVMYQRIGKRNEINTTTTSSVAYNIILTFSAKLCHNDRLIFYTDRGSETVCEIVADAMNRGYNSSMVFTWLVRKKLRQSWLIHGSLLLRFPPQNCLFCASKNSTHYTANKEIHCGSVSINLFTHCQLMATLYHSDLHSNECNKMIESYQNHIDNTIGMCGEHFDKVSIHIQKYMGPTWVPPGSYLPQMDPMLAPWILLSG